MRILLVNSTDRGGGAERVALDLLKSYTNFGHSCVLAVGHKRERGKDVVSIPNSESLPFWGRFVVMMATPLKCMIGRVKGANYLYFLITQRLAVPAKILARFRGHEDFEAPGTSRLLTLTEETPDVMHAHNLHGGGIDLRQLPEISRRIPVVITLHDQWLMTGHCAHTFACERWMIGCGRCPDLGTYPSVRRDKTTFNWQRKNDILSRTHVHVVSPSRWLMDRIERSSIMADTISRSVIPNGVDLSIFHLGDRQEARERLGLPKHDKIVLFSHPGATQSKFKDFPTFRLCADALACSDIGSKIRFITVGPDIPPERRGQAVLHFVPCVTDRETMADYYRATDVYLHPARAENFPLSVLEAMACGCPVVTSNIGGIPEQLTDGIEGFLIEVGDAETMAARVEAILRDEKLALRLGTAGNTRVTEQYSLERMTESYEKLLMSVVSEHKQWCLSTGCQHRL